jgi:N-acetylneuraminic acid mutarotase
MTRPTDPLFDQRIADWLEDDPRHAPGQVLDTVLAALPSIPQRREMRMPWGFRGTPMLARLAAAAVIGALAVGGTFYVIHRGQPAVLGGPSPTPGLSAGTGEPASPSAVPSPSVVPARAASWSVTGNMVTPRSGFSATLLPDGKVLVAGGLNNSNGPGTTCTASAELYDPTTGSWTATGTMATPRSGFSATLLPNGRVLVAGGMNGIDPVMASAELYDPTTGSWSATGAMTTPRRGNTATLLPDGKVLVAGGDNSNGPGATWTASAELYDPTTGSWTATGSMATPRAFHTATLLPDGRVLVAGGLNDGNNDVAALASAELYDATTGSWTATGSMGTPRAWLSGYTATLLLDGKVLVAGGGEAGTTWEASAELYDATTGSWTATGTMTTPRSGYTATLLPNGRVLVAGGLGTRGYNLASAELYDPTTGSWTATATMTTPRSGYTATLLHDGRVLVAGGENGSGPVMASAELYDPGSGG